MDRIIDINVTGCVATRSGKTAGTQGEGNVTTLHITLDDSWLGFGKRIIWRDAAGENPVVTLLFDPSGTSDTLTYDALIPGEPLALPGWCSATLEGYTVDDDGTVQVARTVEIRLQVLINDGFYAPAEPSATEIAQIYDRLGQAEQNLLDYATTAQESAEIATSKRQLIETYATLTKTYVDRCKFYADSVQHTATGLTAVEEDIEQLQLDVGNKLDANQGADSSGMFLVIDENGDIVPGTLDGGGVVQSVAGKVGAVELTTDDIADQLFGDTLTIGLKTLNNSKANRVQSTDYAGKLWAVAEDGDLCFVDSAPVDDTLSQSGTAADAAAVGQCLAALPVQVAADGYTDISGLRKVTALNLASWDNGSFTVTLDGGVTDHYTVSFDSDGRPVTVKDADGHVTTVTWG